VLGGSPPPSRLTCHRGRAALEVPDRVEKGAQLALRMVHPPTARAQLDLRRRDPQLQLAVLEWHLVRRGCDIVA
jgi:hypothetical protein